MRRWNIKKVMRPAIAFGLAGVMCIINPVHTLAASPEEEEGDYVSEVRISTAKTEDAAKDWLWDHGYEVQDQNLNNGTGKDAVYLGYKTTSDPDKAITDMAVMDMKGGYSYGDYEEILKQQEDGVKEIVKSVRVSLKEYRANYSAGMAGAKKAHEVLNGMKEDDSGKKMGDFLLDESVTNKELVKVIMQGNTTAMTAVYRGIALACSESGNDNWLKRLSAIGPDKTLSETYDDMARDIYNSQWDSLRDCLLDYKKSGLKMDASEEEIEKWKEKEGKEKYFSWMQNGQVYEMLDAYSYGKGTLADFFLQEKKDLKIKELYPVVKAMTEGQRAISKLVGLSYLVQVAGTAEKAWKEADEKTDDIMKEAVKQAAKEENTQVVKEVSIYAGVDRSLFEGGVALTNEALRKSASTGDISWIQGNISLGAEIALYAITGTFVAIATTLFVVTYKFQTALALFVEHIRHGLEISNKVWNTAWAVTESDNLLFIAKWGNVMGTIALGIACIVACVYVILEVYNYYHQTYTEIPRILVDEKRDEQGKSTYLYYYAVKDQRDAYGDLNAWKGKQWNALYTTKDKDAGDPITTDMFCQEGADGNVAEEGYSPVHAFGEKAAFNLNNHCYNDDVDGIYMFFAREDTEAVFNGSAFGSGNMMLMAGLGALGGILIGSFFTTANDRRKKKKVAEA